MVPILLFAVFGLPVSVPKGFVSPAENINCADTMLMTIIKKGFPDKIDTSDFDLTGSISLEYNDEDIMGMNMDCRYNYRHNGLYGVSYFTRYDDYDKGKFFVLVDEYMAEKLNEDFKKSEPWVDEDGDGQRVDCYEYAYNTGAVHEVIYVEGYNNEGIIRINYMF